jgi:hemoglobin
MEPTDWERLGGEAGVRRIIDVFVERVFADFIIGFRFEGKDAARVALHELEHAATHLGGELGYTGRGLVSLHRPMRINAGQFRRRLAILRTVLVENGAPEDVIERWMAHDRKLESVFTDGTDCLPSTSPEPPRTRKTP